MLEVLAMNDPKRYATWCGRLKEARQERDRVATHVWKPLARAYLPRLMRMGDAQPEFVNIGAEMVSIMAPHLFGKRQSFNVRAVRVRPDETPGDKERSAKLLSRQLSGLAQAIGLYRTQSGLPGEIPKAVLNSFWSVGVVAHGFNAGRGAATAATGKGYEQAGERDQESGRAIDLDYEAAGRKEQADANMPFARTIDPRHWLCDPTYRSIEQAQWMAIEEYLDLPAARALYPDYADRFEARLSRPPMWGEDETDGEKRLVRLVRIFERYPSREIVLCDEEAGGGLRDCILSEQPLDLGIEGLPFSILGYEWSEDCLYPIPPLARAFDAGEEENAFTRALFDAGRSIKGVTFVNTQAQAVQGAPKLAAQVRDAPKNAVIEVDGSIPLEQISRNVQLGSLQKEHVELAERARETTQRSTGMSDMLAGLREPGNPTNLQLQQREGMMSSRMAHKVDPVREFEAGVGSRLLATAYAKIDLMQGMGFAHGMDPGDPFAVFDANQPVVGEMIDYAFSVQVQTEMSEADEVQSIQNALQLLPNLSPYFAQEPAPKGVALSTLAAALLRKTNVPDADQVIFDLPPPPPAEMGGAMMAEGEEQQAPIEGEQQPAGDPRAELYAALEQIPEGDPAEDEILAQLAQMETMAA